MDTVNGHRLALDMIDEHRFGDCPYWPEDLFDRFRWRRGHEWVKIWDEDHPAWPPIVVGLLCVHCNHTFAYGSTVLLP